MPKKGENLLSGMPSHLLRKGKSLTGFTPVERKIFIRNNTKKAVNLSQGDPGYRMDIGPGNFVELTEAEWKTVQGMFSVSDMLAAGLKFDQEYVPIKGEKKSE